MYQLGSAITKETINFKLNKQLLKLTFEHAKLTFVGWISVEFSLDLHYSRNNFKEICKKSKNMSEIIKIAS